MTSFKKSMGKRWRRWYRRFEAFKRREGRGIRDSMSDPRNLPLNAFGRAFLRERVTSMSAYFCDQYKIRSLL